MGRRYDPDRRQRIVDAAIRVVDRSGIAGLSHRAVAAEADVPLGSTTYHFSGLDDLLVAALRQVGAEWLADLERWEADADPGQPLAEEVAGLVERWLSGDRGRAVLEYELYLAALRREAVRPIAAATLDEMTRVLCRRTRDEATARALTGLVDGLMLQHLLTGRPVDRDEVRSMVERVVG
ncbi:MAG TPA: TetR family transcriptional regulator [Streptomyces sp.]|nr:TetR family transcriptional regulator [Streptomyces sp.]